MFTQQELIRLLHYNPETGIWTRLVSTSNSVKVGDVAGGLNKQGYRSIRVKGKLYRSSRLAWFYMTGMWPESTIDHINKNKSDDRWCNLRPATQSQNCFNKNLQSNNKSGIKGVWWSTEHKKWSVSGKYQGKVTFLGYYNNLSEAKMVRDQWEEKVHGEYRSLK